MLNVGVVSEKILDCIRNCAQIQPGITIVAACSGGADSMALTHALAKVAQEIPFKVCVLHVQHHLRGKEAEHDARVVRNFAASCSLSFQQVDVDVQSLVSAQGLSVEDAARQLRYAALEAYRHKIAAEAIFLAHHRDDQAETVFLNLLRGAGIRGLRGMLPVQKFLVRPFLPITRSEIEVYCQENKITYCTDSSNNDINYKRNWLRKELLPLLEKVNPQIKKQLAQTAELAACDEEFLDTLAQTYFSKYSKKIVKGYELETGPDFLALHKAVQTRVIRILLQKAGGIAISYEHVQSILQLFNNKSRNKKVDVPKVRVVYANGTLQAGKPLKTRQEERAEKIKQKERQRHA